MAGPRSTSAYKALAREVCRPRPGARCWLCNEQIVFHLRPRHPLGPSLDHVVPLAKGGSLLAPGNARLAHYGCNSSRGDSGKMPDRTIKRLPLWE